MRQLPTLTLLAAIAGTAPLTAQSQPSAGLKNQLRNLVVAEEAYYADHGTYTTDVSVLGLYKRRAPGAPMTAADSIWVQVIQAGGRSWWGRASHQAYKGKSCVIYVGAMEDFPAPPATEGGKLKAQMEGQPLCDAF